MERKLPAYPSPGLLAPSFHGRVTKDPRVGGLGQVKKWGNVARGIIKQEETIGRSFVISNIIKDLIAVLVTTASSCRCVAQVPVPVRLVVTEILTIM